MTGPHSQQLLPHLTIYECVWIHMSKKECVCVCVCTYFHTYLGIRLGIQRFFLRGGLPVLCKWNIKKICPTDCYFHQWLCWLVYVNLKSFWKREPQMRNVLTGLAYRAFSRLTDVAHYRWCLGAVRRQTEQAIRSKAPSVPLPWVTLELLP